MRTRSARKGRLCGERGATAVEMSIVLPLLFTVLLLAVQAGMWFFARSIALAAAEEGARSSASRYSSLDTGLADADTFLARVAGTSLSGTSVTSTTVTVTGTSVRLIPLMDLAVTQTATMPVERLT
jgi:Flp pilus assembly protein TadG